jgi:hypothetical protein
MCRLLPIVLAVVAHAIAGCDNPVTQARQAQLRATQAQAEVARAQAELETAKALVAAEDALAQAQKAAIAQPAPAPVAEAPKLLTEAELADGWIALFDGTTTFGWTQYSAAEWRVKDGAIFVDSGEKGLLCTSVPFDDYELALDFRAAQGTNSGVFLRTAGVVGMDDIKTKCYELNIAPPDNPFPTGSFVGRQKAKEVPEKAGEWQSFHVMLDGPKATVKLNGEEILNYTDPAPIGRGLIGLQLNSGQVEFKNIKLRPLGLAPLFNGRDLTGWKNHPDSKSTFKVTDKGEINVTSTGRGALESDAQFGDFLVQMEAISHAPNLNSGLFFRCIPGELTNGYECQIHNGYKGGDRTQPADFGTGGIYRRVPARLVVPNDQEWFSMTIAAAGPQINVWVNGYQVTNWKDDRQPDKNPRNGLRTEEGTLQLQGHDPTTNLSFRNIRARELKGNGP